MWKIFSKSSLLRVLSLLLSLWRRKRSTASQTDVLWESIPKVGFREYRIFDDELDREVFALLEYLCAMKDPSSEEAKDLSRRATLTRVETLRPGE